MAIRKMNRIRKKRRIRKKIRGTAEKPRLAVYRSSKHIYAQVIDDDAGKTLAFASSLLSDLPESEEEGGKSVTATRVGKMLAQKCQSLGVTTVVFDRGGYEYHGRVARLADGAREGGLNF